MADETARARVTRGMPPSEEIRRRIQLSFGKSARIAWRNIRVRLGRSLLVTASIVLALSFLTYILCSDILTGAVAAGAPREIVERLQAEGKLTNLSDADARVRTWWLVGLALMVSFIAILNAMLLSVTERFREIGTMKCLGALDSLVVRLFLMESLFQGLIGTVIGVLIGVGLAGTVIVLAVGGRAWGLVPYGRLILYSLLCSAVGIGLTSAGAVYPARRASKMQPVDAMRLEV